VKFLPIFQRGQKKARQNKKSRDGGPKETTYHAFRTAQGPANIERERDMTIKGETDSAQKREGYSFNHGERRSRGGFVGKEKKLKRGRNPRWKKL